MKIVVSPLPSLFQRAGIVWPSDWEVEQISFPFDVETLRKAAVGAEILYVRSVDVLSKEFIDAIPSVRLIQTVGVSFDKIDCEYAASKGIAVCNSRGGNSLSVAEHVVGLMLAGRRRTAQVSEKVFHEGWQVARDWAMGGFGVHELYGYQIGLIGFGAIGKEVAKRLQGWGVNIVYYDPYRASEEVEKELNVTYMELDDLIRTSDVITINLPVTPTTRGLINKERVASMKQNALFINCARGEVMDNEAIVEALEAGRIYACLDTVSPEPVAQDHPLRNMSPEATARVTWTTHLAGAPREATARGLAIGFKNVTGFAKGEAPINKVN